VIKRERAAILGVDYWNIARKFNRPALSCQEKLPSEGMRLTQNSETSSAIMSLTCGDANFDHALKGFCISLNV